MRVYFLLFFTTKIPTTLALFTPTGPPILGDHRRRRRRRRRRVQLPTMTKPVLPWSSNASSGRRRARRQKRVHSSSSPLRSRRRRRRHRQHDIKVPSFSRFRCASSHSRRRLQKRFDRPSSISSTLRSPLLWRRRPRRPRRPRRAGGGGGGAQHGVENDSCSRVVFAKTIYTYYYREKRA